MARIQADSMEWSYPLWFSYTVIIFQTLIGREQSLSLTLQSFYEEVLSVFLAGKSLFILISLNLFGSKSDTSDLSILTMVLYLKTASHLAFVLSLKLCELSW